jgi:glycosyltransferase involved in cell wall biosynthesis
MIRVQIWLIIQKIGLKPDLVWSFAGFLFENLKWFGASKSIFFVADLFEESVLPSEVFSADIVLGVSDSICNVLSKSGVNVHFINHGLNKFFEKEALQKLGSSLQTIGLKNSFDKIKVGYVGNLRMEAIDRGTMKSLIKRFKDLQFIFWGSYDQKDANLGGITNLETEDWIGFLKQQSNVELRGTVNTERLAIEIQDVDLFWICWKIGVTKAWDGSNSHKILEYLSTGKPIVSHFVSTYKDSTLFYMLSETKNTNYEALFNSVLDRVKINESSTLVEDRIKYSLSNTYHSHLNFIESLLFQG